MTAIVRFLACSYLFFASWTEAFALGPWMPLPNLFGFLALALFLPLKGGRLTFGALRMEDFLLLLLVCAVTFAALVHPNDKTLNYLLAYFATFFLLYLLMKQVFVSLVPPETALGVNAAAVMLTAFFVVFVEFIPKAFLGFDVQQFTLRSVAADAAYLGIIPRAYGFSTEPTNLGFYFDTLGLVGLWHFRAWTKDRRLLRRAGSTLFAVAWLLTLSAAAMVALPFGLVLAALLLHGKEILSLRLLRRWPGRVIAAGVLAAGMAMALHSASDGLEDYATPLVYKILLHDTDADGRPEKWKRDLALIEKRPLLGQGPGASAALSGSEGSVNWYLFMTLESGLISLLPALLFLLVSLGRIVRTPFRGRYVFAAGFSAGILHLATVSRFYDPFPWLLLILFFTVSEAGRLRARQTIPPAPDSAS
ncbi:MAG: O-antigen ligase family protein [Sulfuricella denitrificans]|nr:O-antigen ligase family protein [Sulfuricella denitrificans]